MISQQYLVKVREILNHLEQTQMSAIERAAELIAKALTHQGLVYCAELGHGLQADFINRAGGLAAIQSFTFNVSVASSVPRCYQNRPRGDHWEQDLETVRFAVQSSNLRSGDVMLVSSVSGRNRVPVELALACRAKGIRVIGFTSLAYSRVVAALHPSGRRLAEVVDVVIDLGVPLGDAALDVPGYDAKLIPLSGVALDVAGWMMLGRVMEMMAERGQPLTVFSSINLEGGEERYRQSQEQYEKRGF
ncbi:MAG: sugar isomerase domain-containing protein [Lentisphaerae bacterium]|nr:sugar isomerase domain-containing protein [Lentisphaerota bacterium]